MTTRTDIVTLISGTVLKRNLDSFEFDLLGTIADWEEIIGSIKLAFPIQEMFSPLEIRIYDIRSTILQTENQQGIKNLRNPLGLNQYAPVDFLYHPNLKRLDIAIYPVGNTLTEKSRYDAFKVLSRKIGYHFSTICGLLKNFAFTEYFEFRFSASPKLKNKYPAVKPYTTLTGYTNAADVKKREDSIVAALSDVFCAFFGFDKKPPSVGSGYSVRGTLSDNSLFWKTDDKAFYITMLCMYNIYNLIKTISRSPLAYLFTSDKKDDWISYKDSITGWTYFYLLGGEVVTETTFFPKVTEALLLSELPISSLQTPYLYDREFWERSISETNKPSSLTQDVLTNPEEQGVILTETYELENKLSIQATLRRISSDVNFDKLGTIAQWEAMFSSIFTVLPYASGVFSNIKIFAYDMNAPVLKKENEQGIRNLRDYLTSDGLQTSRGLYWPLENKLDIGFFSTPWNPMNTNIVPISESDKGKAFKTFSHEFGHHYENVCLGGTVPAALATFMKNKFTELFNNDPRPGINNDFKENWAEVFKAFFGYNEVITDIETTKSGRGVFSTHPEIKYWRPDNKLLYSFMKFAYRFITETRNYSNGQIAGLSDPATGLVVRENDLYWHSPDNKITQILLLFSRDQISVKKHNSGSPPPVPSQLIDDPIPSLYAFDFSSIAPPPPVPNPEEPPPSPEPPPVVVVTSPPTEEQIENPLPQEADGVLVSPPPVPVNPSPIFPVIKDIVQNVYR